MEKRTLLALLREASSAHPDRTYMKERHPDGWKEASFSAINSETRRIAGFLLSLGLGRGERVTLLAEGRNSWISSELGIVMAGGIAVPISVKIKERSEILFRMQHSGSRFAIVTEKTLEKVVPCVPDLPDLKGVLVMDELAEKPGCTVPVWMWPEVLETGGDFATAHAAELDAIEQTASEDDPVTLNYTSGTTAEPKGILLTHKNYYVNTCDVHAMFPLPEPLSMLLILPWDHSFGQTAGLFTFLKKASIIAAVEPAKTELGTIRNIPKNLKEVGPAYLLVVPALVENFRKNIATQVKQKGGLAAAMFNATIAMGTRVNGDYLHKRYDPISLLAWPVYLLLRTIIAKSIRRSLGGNLVFMVSGGSACSPDHQRWFTALGIPLYQGYGLSETSPIIAASSNRRRAFKIGTSGRPFPWAELRIAGEDGQALPTGETGEIWVRGDCVMKGYWCNEEATREAVVDGWFHTGDLGFVDADGFLSVVGRIKSLLVGENGEKYSPEALEQHIVDSIPLLQQVMLYNQQNPFTVALVVPDPQKIRELLDRRGIAADSAEGVDAAIEAVRVGFMRYRKDPGLASQFVVTWAPKTFAFLPEPFEESNGMMNASMKIVRRRIVAAYQSRIDRLYAGEEDPMNPANREVLRSWLARTDA
ncbi:MAG TPA: AMP-binding protein [Spirochaetia bacterium]